MGVLAASRKIVISEDGDLSFIHHDDLEGFCGEVAAAIHIERASHVNYGRTEKPGWYADLGPSGGPVLGPFQSRAEALSAELTWLDLHDEAVAAFSRRNRRNKKGD